MDLTFVDRALGSNVPYITYAVPFFFLLMGVELVVALWQRQHSYRLHDSINDLSCGITEQVVGIFLKGLLFTGYLKTYGFATQSGFNWVDVQAYSHGGKWVAAIVLFLGVDCATTGSIGSPMSTTPRGPGTWCTIRVKITTWRSHSGRGRSRDSFRGFSTCRSHSWAFHLLGLPRCQASTRSISSGSTRGPSANWDRSSGS